MSSIEGSRMRRPLKQFRSRVRPRTVAMALSGVAGFALAALTGIAIAKTFTVKAAKNVKVTNLITHVTKTEGIVVDSRGVAVYTLSGETTHHLECTSATCFGFWPPLKVHSAHAKLTEGAGVKGKLGILHRDGFFQVTLGGHPLYGFMIDKGKKGIAMGEGVTSFGGTWHVVKDPSGGKQANGGGGGGPTTTTTSTNPYPTTTYPTTTTTTSTTPPYPPY
jgi:predicted lipoprotein with Yx(FWY)xxD motif